MTDRSDRAEKGENLDQAGHEYSVDRTILANERTYAAWIQTGLTALAAGVAIEWFMVDVMPSWGTRIIAIVLIPISAVAFIIAAWRYTQQARQDFDAEADPRGDYLHRRKISPSFCMRLWRLFRWRPTSTTSSNFFLISLDETRADRAVNRRAGSYR